MTHVSMIAVRALAAVVEGAGVERERFLAEAGLTASQLADANARISLADYSRVRRAALATSGNPALGLHMGGQVSVGNFDVLGSLAEHSTCLREAFQVAARYARIFTEGPQLELEETGDVATLRCAMLLGESPEIRLTSEFVTSSLLYLVRRFVGGAAQARRVFFAYAAPAHRAEYTRVFAGREQFSHPFTGLEIDRAWLDRSHAYRSPELHALLQTRAELLLAKVERSTPTAERVKRWLASQALDTRPTMDTIARALGMSSRSLRRRLQRECAHYDDLVETRGRCAPSTCWPTHASRSRRPPTRWDSARRRRSRARSGAGRGARRVPTALRTERRALASITLRDPGAP